MCTWSAVYNSVRYHVIPRLANRRLIACWIVLVELCAKIIADVESGNVKRQKRVVSIGDVRGYSYGKKKEFLLIENEIN